MQLDKLLETLTALKSLGNTETSSEAKGGLNSFVGKKAIIRTYSAGVHYGEIVEKSGKEVILKNSRRLWYWRNKEDYISLSEIAKYGPHSDSKICAPVDIWLEAIEIIPCTDRAIKIIEAADVYKA